MNTKTYAIGDKVLVRHHTGNFQATIIEVGDSVKFWGSQYTVRFNGGQVTAYANEFVEPGDYDYIF